MTPSQKVALSISETREKLNVLLSKETRSAEENTELDALTNKMKGLEVEARAAIAAEPTFIELPATGREAKELRELVNKADLGAMMDNILEHRSATGAEAEIIQHYGLDDNQIPVAMLQSAQEQRAVTPAPGNVQSNQDPIIAGVFPDSAAAFLSIDRPVVPVGEKIYPVLTQNAEVKTPAKNISAAETTGAFDAEIIKPGRLQASFFYSYEDKMTFAGMDEALRQNLGDALADGLDKQILVGNPKGLLHGTVLANNNVSAVTTYANYREHFMAGRVDGKYASRYSDLRILMGAETYAHADSVWRGTNTNNDVSVLDVLMARAAGVQVSAHVPAAVSNKQNSIVRRGSRRDAVAPVWQGIQIIPDNVTLADKGQVKVTAIMLFAVQVLRAAGFHKQQTQHA